MLVSVSARAQPAAAPPNPPPPLSEGTAEFSFVGTTGNTSTESIGLGGEYTYRPDPWLLTSKATYVRNRSQDVLKAESFDVSLKGARSVGPRLSVFSRYEFLHDRFAGIERRHVIEAGPSYHLVDSAPHSLTIDASLGYAHESRVMVADVSNGTASAGSLYTLKISANAEASEDARLVASLAQGADWRFTNVASVTAKITTLLSLKVSNTVRYLHAPITGFQNTDTITAIALVAKFTKAAS